jgi:hypothetical protein
MTLATCQRPHHPEGTRGFHVDVGGTMMSNGNTRRYMWRLPISDEVITRKFPRTLKGNLTSFLELKIEKQNSHWQDLGHKSILMHSKI